MERPVRTHVDEGRSPKAYVGKVVLEPDDAQWAAYCPALLKQGASTWGSTREEAPRNIEQVVKMLVESLGEHREAVRLSPEGA